MFEGEPLLVDEEMGQPCYGNRFLSKFQTEDEEVALFMYDLDFKVFKKLEIFDSQDKEFELGDFKVKCSKQDESIWVYNEQLIYRGFVGE